MQSKGKKGKPKSKAKQQKNNKNKRKKRDWKGKETNNKSFDKKRKGKEKKECKEMNWKEENHIKEINNGKQSKTSSTEIWIRIRRQSKAKQVRARLEEVDRQGDKDTSKEKKAKKNAITKQIGNWKQSTEKPLEKRRKYRETFRTNNNKRKAAQGRKGKQKAAESTAGTHREQHWVKQSEREMEAKDQQSTSKLKTNWKRGNTKATGRREKKQSRK